MHTKALCHRAIGQFVDDANSKVTLPLWMLVRGHFKYSAGTLFWDKAREARLLTYFHSSNGTYLGTHPALRCARLTCNPQHCETLSRG